MIFETIEQNDAQCRCCGSGKTIVCTKCTEGIAQGYVYLVEILVLGKKNYRYFTGYVTRAHSSKLRIPGSSEYFLPGLYLVEQTHLKTSMKNEYDFSLGGRKRAEPKQLAGGFETDNPQQFPAGSPRHALELSHKRKT